MNVPQTPAAQVSLVSRISAVPAILQVICDTTGLRFAAIAHVTEDSWTACAVLDLVDFGLEVGGELDISTTLCREVREAREPVIISHASEDPRYCDHHTPKLYGFESYLAAPIYLSDGRFFGTICALDPLPRDLSQPRTLAMLDSFCKLLALQLEAEQRHDSTEEALLDAQHTAEVREQFIALLGHDLRNPLSSIVTGAELLTRRVDARLEPIARHMLAAGQRAARLVDDMLDFARGRLGNGIPLTKAATADLESKLTHVVMEIQTAHPSQQIISDIEPLGTVVCDADRVAQILSNLLANAVAHGAPGRPIDVSARRAHGQLSISVHNLGKPIPADRLPGLFQPFWRSEDATPRSGLGLGLFIAAEIARCHGGELTVDSTAERGTRFTFTLPLD